MAREPGVFRYAEPGRYMDRKPVEAAKSAPFERAAAAKIQKVQDSMTAARKGKSLFGLKK